MYGRRMAVHCSPSRWFRRGRAKGIRPRRLGAASGSLLCYHIGKKEGRKGKLGGEPELGTAMAAGGRAEVVCGTGGAQFCLL